MKVFEVSSAEQPLNVYRLEANDTSEAVARAWIEYFSTRSLVKTIGSLKAREVTEAELMMDRTILTMYRNYDKRHIDSRVRRLAETIGEIQRSGMDLEEFKQFLLGWNGVRSEAAV